MDILEPFIEMLLPGPGVSSGPLQFKDPLRMPVMRSIELPSKPSEEKQASPFGPEANGVLQTLRSTIAAALSDVGDFSKPADVYKVLGLDRTLARQLFRLASTSEAISNGGMIPSRTSIDRFLAAAESRRASGTKIKAVREAYGQFETLVQTHAGDRATFNSMVSAASGLDDSWHATDLQHRRNAYRAMSHAVGIQAKTRLVFTVVREDDARSVFEAVMISGFIGLRVLRAFPTVRVSGITANPQDVHNRSNISIGPIALSGACGGYVLEEFSSSPLPALSIRDGSNTRGDYREIVLDQPTVGNIGSCTLMLGSHVCGLPRKTNDPLRLHAAGGKPVETLLLDVLIAPGLRRGDRPSGQAVIGLSEEFNPEIIRLQGNFQPEYLGKGSRALATPEVPRYIEMIQAIDAKIAWSLEAYDAWRIRVDFPIYQSKISMEWPSMTEAESLLET